jgi:hypothetical protein
MGFTDPGNLRAKSAEYDQLTSRTLDADAV